VSVRIDLSTCLSSGVKSISHAPTATISKYKTESYTNGSTSLQAKVRATKHRAADQEVPKQIPPIAIVTD